MDPQREWERMVRAYAARDWGEVERAADGLLYWLDHGGPPPDVAAGPRVGPTWNWAVARYACELSLLHARRTGAA